MAAINFSSGTTISGANGKIYIFNVSLLSIYKIQDVFIYRNLTTDTWQACKIDSFPDLCAMLTQTAAIDSDKAFSYFYADGVLYIFVAIYVDDAANMLVIRRKRGFILTTDDAQKFDVFDTYLPVLVDYAEWYYAGVVGSRISKFAQRRIDDFERSFPPESQ